MITISKHWSKDVQNWQLDIRTNDLVAYEGLVAIIEGLPSLEHLGLPNSIGEELGFEPGDQLLSINGVRPRDLIDFRYLCVEEELSLEVRDTNGELHRVDLEKDADDGLGLGFTEALFDGLRQCNNNCPWLFGISLYHFIFSIEFICI